MESIVLTDDQYAQIHKLLDENSELLVAAHHAMIWSVYSTGNRDVSMLVDDLDKLVESPDNIPSMMGGPDRPVTLKTRDVEGYSREVYEVTRRCTEIVNDPRIHYTSVHILDADKGSKSFEDHTDPVDVIMFVVSGTKDIIITEDGVERTVVLTAGQSLYMPLGVIHRIINNHASTMMSVGLERFHLDHIQEEI